VRHIWHLAGNKNRFRRGLRGSSGGFLDLVSICRANRTEYLISQLARIVSPDDLPDADGIQPDDRDSLKFPLPKEGVDVWRKPFAAQCLYAYQPVRTFRN